MVRMERLLDKRAEQETRMNEIIRWTDKVYLDSRGNIHCSTNTDIVTEDIINKIKVNASLAKPKKEAENEANRRSDF